MKRLLIIALVFLLPTAFAEISHSPKELSEGEEFTAWIDTDGDVTWFDWKGYQLRKIDAFFSSLLRKIIIKALNNPNNPSLADRLVKKYSFQFVEIRWTFRKAT